MRPMTRRTFLGSCVAGTALTAMPLTSWGQEPASKLATDPMRPQFHLLPARNWMNDPNGPIYFRGKYHMFYQYNPMGATWGNMSWAHAISPDMVHWQHLPVAMRPTAGGDDAYGVFSGSALAVGDRVYAVYTGTKQGAKELATIGGDPNNVQESQCLAWSDDPELRRWTKASTPIVPLPPPGMKITGFRDPSAWKQDEWYYMTVGAGEAKVGGCVLLYRSRDLHHWEYLHKLTSGTWNGKWTSNPCDDGEMWECPELFPLDGAHVLIYSTLGKVYWQSGVLDETTMLFHPKKTGLLDLDSFYAPKTQRDAHGRRILWGWIQERRSEDAMRAAGWSGMMSLPRVLNLDADGTLRMSIAEQVNVLRGQRLTTQESRAGVLKVIPRATGEVLCRGEHSRSFTTQFSLNDGPLLRIDYAGETHSFSVGTQTIMLQPGDLPTVHAYVDGSVLEVVLGQRIGCTKRFYYTAQTAPDIAVLTTGDAVAVEAWSLMPISPDRLTASA